MPGLLGPDGQPISSAQMIDVGTARKISNKKADPPKLGPAYGNWAGRDQALIHEQIPGGQGVVQFNLDNLTLADFRTMRDHYQVNSSLSVLSFMQHQSDWSIQGSTPQINSFCEEQLRGVWTQMNRALSQANWAGYSPSVLEWENNPITGAVDLNKVKDLFPEECRVHWKLEPMWAPPGVIPSKTKIFDGFWQRGTAYPIPPGNAFWYPILMENGNFHGKKLLRPAFTSYFFSFLMHLFANRYYERFGEPVPVGRAPFDEELDVTVNGAVTTMRSTDYMLGVLQNLRNRSVVVLPADRSQDDAGRGYFDYDISYLESQMRGADFERYMERLDQEISLALFTPILLMNVADVGSYNLGQGHTQMYFYMLNALNADRAFYLDRYVLSPMTDMNFSPKAPRPHIVFRPLGNSNPMMIQAIITALIQNSMARPDLTELGQMAGMTLTEIQQTVAPEGGDPATDPNADPKNSSSSDGKVKNKIILNTLNGLPRIDGFENVITVASAISDRVKRQVNNAFRNGNFNSEFELHMGYKKQLFTAIDEAHIGNARGLTNELYDRLGIWHSDMTALGIGFTSKPDEYMARFDAELGHGLSEIARRV